MTAPEPTGPCDVPVAAAKFTAQDPTDLPAVAAKLIETIDELTKAIQDLLHRTARSEKQTRRQWIVIGLIAVVTAFSGITYYQQIQTSQTLDATRGDVLCPTWAVFLGSYNPSTRAEGADREYYEETFVVIRDGYKQLGCTLPLVPPATPRSSPPR